MTKEQIIKEIYCIDRISKWLYLRTIFGNTMPIDEIILTKDEIDYSLDGDFIFSIGKKAIILTKKIDGKRIPILVKQITPIPHEEFQFWYPDDEVNKHCGYRDNDGHEWRVSKTKVLTMTYIEGVIRNNTSIQMIWTPLI
ncbi:MAG: hypothetical protein HYU68_07635 [Bacteroidetes bacterium]|nr:hypothetical protein [Bacteroidota bacterium]